MNLPAEVVIALIATAGAGIAFLLMLEEAIALAIEAGGQLVDKGEHAPGIPYAYISDPDGYVIEI